MQSHSTTGCGSAFARLIDKAMLPGSNLTLVPLTGSDLPAVVDENTYRRLRDLGFPPTWNYNNNGNGKGYVKAHLACVAAVTVARFIHANPPARFRVKFRNGESRDLRRDNVKAVRISKSTVRRRRAA